jgi:hypothetical protein
MIDHKLSLFSTNIKYSFSQAMKNYRAMSRKVARECLERDSISIVNKQFPNVEQYISKYRFPTLPKIVVYSTYASTDKYLQTYPINHLEFSPFTISSTPNQRLKVMRLSLVELLRNLFRRIK